MGTHQPYLKTLSYDRIYFYLLTSSNGTLIRYSEHKIWISKVIRKYEHRRHAATYYFTPYNNIRTKFLCTSTNTYHSWNRTHLLAFPTLTRDSKYSNNFNNFYNHSQGSHGRVYRNLSLYHRLNVDILCKGYSNRQLHNPPAALKHHNFLNSIF